MTATGAPRLSVVIVTPDAFAAIRRTVECLARQSALGALELVVVAPSLAALDADEALLAAFPRVVRVACGPVGSIGPANAAGVRHASAPIVALAEDHAFPDPEWAERLIAAHDGPWAAVGPSVRNANPASACRHDHGAGCPGLARASRHSRTRRTAGISGEPAT